MDAVIRSSNDLRNEIQRLENLSKEQGGALKSHFNSPKAVFSTLFGLIYKPSSADDEKTGGVFSQDFVGLISRFVLPLALNKTLFRNSNFIVKALVGLASQKASKYISEDSVSGVWHKVLHLFEGHEHAGKTVGGGILGTIKSLFETKKRKKAVNHPAHAPATHNVLKTKV